MYNITHITVENNVLEINFSNTSFEVIVANTPLNSIDDVITYLSTEDIFVAPNMINFIK